MSGGCFADLIVPGDHRQGPDIVLKMLPRSLRTLFLKNAFANVIGGAGTALFNLLLPALVVHHLSRLEFSVWTLALQVVVYVQMFGFGLQTVITYNISKANTESNLVEQRATICAGLKIAIYFCTGALLSVMVLVAFYPVLFNKVPANLISEFRFCLAVLGISAVAQLFALVPIGAFTGLHRNIIPVLAQLFVRTFSLLMVWIVLHRQVALPVLACVLSIASFLIVPISFGAARKWIGKIFSGFAKTDSQRVRSMLKDCMGLAVWNVAMLLIGGVDILIVGRFDFDRVAAYSLATTAVTIFIGVLQALLNPLVALGASLHARGSADGRLERLLLLSTRYCSVFLVGTTIIFAAIGSWLLPFWVGAAYVADVRELLIILMIAYSIRNLMAPYAVLLVAIGRQREGLRPAILEGVVNLVCTLYLVERFGAKGAAYGTLIGAIVGVVAILLSVFVRTKELAASRHQFIAKTLALPSFALAMVFYFSLK